MRIKIIKNKPPKSEELHYSDITQYIGREFEVSEKDKIGIDPEGNPNNGFWVDEIFKEIYEGEYEIIEN